jgi:hypothetical protein
LKLAENKQMSRYIREIGAFATVLLGVIGIGLVLMVTGAIIFITNCADWMGRACIEQVGWVPKPLVDVPLVLIGFGVFTGGIVILVIYHYLDPVHHSKS